MIFGNPLLAELDILFSSVEELKSCLVLLERDQFAGDEEEKLKRASKIARIVAKLKKYSGEELRLFVKEDLSEHAKKFIQEIAATFTNEVLGTIGQGINPLDKIALKKLLLLISRMERVKELLLLLETDVKFEEIQKNKAKKLAKPKLVFTEKGCYHYTDPSRIISILSRGLLSVNYAKQMHQLRLEIALDNFQGSDYLSVYDPYSYWCLFLYFQKHGKLNQIIREKRLSPQELEEALKANPQLNLSRFAKINIEILEQEGFFDEWSMNFDFFVRSMILVAKDGGASYLKAEHGPFCFVINDTALFFPRHSNAYEFEGLFENQIAAKKVSGAWVRDEQYLPYIEEFGKFTGLPVYNNEGVLLWPK